MFDHEKLKVYQESIRFVCWADERLLKIPRTLAAHNQLDRASTSIPLNIAEGNGKYTDADRCRFFDIARGSALECAACLDVLVAKKTDRAIRLRQKKFSPNRLDARRTYSPHVFPSYLRTVNQLRHMFRRIKRLGLRLRLCPQKHQRTPTPSPYHLFSTLSRLT